MAIGMFVQQKSSMSNMSSGSAETTKNDADTFSDNVRRDFLSNAVRLSALLVY